MKIPRISTDLARKGSKVIERKKITTPTKKNQSANYISNSFDIKINQSTFATNASFYCKNIFASRSVKDFNILSLQEASL